MAVGPLVLTVNVGSASKKYALYSGDEPLVAFHFEIENGAVVCGITDAQGTYAEPVNISSLDDAVVQLLPILTKHAYLADNQAIAAIGIRIVAPTSYFLEHRFIDAEAIKKLETLLPKAPLHIGATLNEIKLLSSVLSQVPIFGVSDSAFHAQKPDYAWNYGISLALADAHEIKRFGYHGISVESVVQKLGKDNLLEEKVIVCHLGSGSSVTAVLNGVSVDNSMGYSPLEGLVMATRSGSLDIAAASEIKKQLAIDDTELELVLNKQSGLLGISGLSSDIRELLEAETEGHYRAGLALSMYVVAVQKAIGQMAAELGGVDTLIFTGTVGARSAIMRQRIIANLEFLNFAIKPSLNESTYEPPKPTKINPRTRQKNIYVITTDESYEIALRTLWALNSDS